VLSRKFSPLHHQKVGGSESSYGCYEGAGVESWKRLGNKSSSQ
jgi:hypothetical protein